MQNEELDETNSGGEFTRFFRSGDPVSAKPSADAPKLPEPAAPSQSTQSATRPLTKMFTAKAQPQRPPHAPQPPAYEPKLSPGEFTRMFGAPTLPTPAPPAAPSFNVAQHSVVQKQDSWPTPTQGNSNGIPGEFTEMFGKKASPAKAPAQVSPASWGSSAAVEEPVMHDEYARVVAGPRARTSAAAEESQTPGSELNGQATTAPKLWVPLALTGVVVILAALAIYLLVLRG